MTKLVFYYLTFCVSLCVCQESCINIRPLHERHLGSNTPYRFVANNTFGKIEYPGCTTKKLWMITRHGTRYPSVKFIGQLSKRLPEIRDLILENNNKSSEILHNSDITAFKKWHAKLKTKDEMKLTHEGKDEMMNLAERMQSRFPSVLQNEYSNTSYRFKYTATRRTKKSAEHFAKGLFGKKIAKSVWYPEAENKDPILRFYKLCTKWNDEIKKNPDSRVHVMAFINSSFVVKTVENINKNLNLEKGTLNYSDIHLIYEACGFETAWEKGSRSPWCSVFTAADFKVLEYAEDLKYYWVDGFGYELTHKQACVALTELMNVFSSDDPFPEATLYFTHSGSLLKLLAHLQLYKDDKPLTLAEFDKMTDNRHWRVSHIDTFGTNLAFVLYDCNGVSKVLTLHQEHIVRLPCCPNEDLCDMDVISNYYQNSENQKCDFDGLCENDENDDD